MKVAVGLGPRLNAAAFMMRRVATPAIEHNQLGYNRLRKQWILTNPEKNVRNDKG
jgi:hypothetical protein